MHLSDEALATLDEETPTTNSQERTHFASCAECRLRRDEVLQLRAMLARAGKYERRPARNVIPGALKRLRLRHHTITNANEFLSGLVGFVRGFASLFAVSDLGERSEEPGGIPRKRDVHE
jgi:hypothetical protein